MVRIYIYLYGVTVTKHVLIQKGWTGSKLTHDALIKSSDRIKDLYMNWINLYFCTFAQSYPLILSSLVRIKFVYYVKMYLDSITLSMVMDNIYSTMNVFYIIYMLVLVRIFTRGRAIVWWGGGLWLRCCSTIH
jgi:hypothetical protein